jgi:long-chain acyl-CoA synthetase
MVPGEIREAFARIAADRRHRIAIRGLSEHLTRTFGDLESDVRTMGRALDGLALPALPTIVASVGNRSGFVPLFLASLERGAGLLALDGGAPLPEILPIATRLSADLIVIRADEAEAIGVPTEPLACGLVAIRHEASTPAAWRARAETGALVLRLTSGSTRRPKFVVTTESRLVSDGRHIIEAMDIRPSDVVLAAVPMAHAYGTGNVLLPLLLQGASVVMRDRFVPAQLAEDLSTCGITMFPGVPFLFDYLGRLGPVAALIASVRMLITAGAPIDACTVRFFKETVGRKIHSLYGTSETGGITFDASEDFTDPVSVGRPLPGVSVTLVDGLDLAPGEGRVLVRGGAVAARYALAESGENEVSAFTSGGFLTSDVARSDADGGLVLVSRLAASVNVAGRKVDPREVERVIGALAGVQQVSVIGAVCPVRGEILAACVRRCDPTLTVCRIRAHCSAHLSAHKIPRVVVFTDHLPVDARGKIERRALDALVAETLDALRSV